MTFSFTCKVTRIITFEKGLKISNTHTHSSWVPIFHKVYIFMDLFNAWLNSLLEFLVLIEAHTLEFKENKGSGH